MNVFNVPIDHGDIAGPSSNPSEQSEPQEPGTNGNVIIKDAKKNLATSFMTPQSRSTPKFSSNPEYNHYDEDINQALKALPHEQITLRLSKI